MPYIITAGSKYRKDHSLKCWPLPRGGSAPERCNCDFMDNFSRTAVATLEEAADQIERIADAWLNSVPEDDYTVETHRQYRRIIEAWHAWDESGGTVGPLPDGTVIEVRQAGYVEIAAAVDNKPATWTSEQSILAAYNAA